MLKLDSSLVSGLLSPKITWKCVHFYSNILDEA